MSSKSIATIIKDVHICIDEIAINDAEMDNSGNGFGNESYSSEQDNAEMDTIIRKHIFDALTYLGKNADVALLSPDTILTELSTDVTYDTTTKVVYVKLPDTFLRLCYARLSSWPYAVTDVIFWTDTEYAALQNDYSTGTWERPKVAVAEAREAMTTSELYKRVELYKAHYVEGDSKDTVIVGIVTDHSADADNESKTSIDIDDRLYRALIYYTAGLTCMTYNEQRADNFFNQALMLAGIQTTQS